MEIDILAEAKQFAEDLTKVHPSEEWGLFKPKNEFEVIEFYKKSESYLVANAYHRIPKIQLACFSGRCLDFGGGAGNVSVFLAQRGVEVDYIDINKIQQNFIKKLAEKYLLNINVVEEPSGLYDGLVMRDVVEHLVDYRKELAFLFKFLKPGAFIFSKPEFDEKQQKGQMNIHFNDHYGYEGFMRKYAEPVVGHKNLWQKS